LDFIGINDCESESQLAESIVEAATRLLEKITDGLTAY